MVTVANGPRCSARRSGIALIAALGVMTLLGLLIAGAVAANTLAHRAATAQLDQGDLTSALDIAAAQTLAAADSLDLADLRQGSSLAFDAPRSGTARARVSVVATVLGRGVLWIALDSRALGDSTHRRRGSLIARFPLAGVIPRGPIVGQDTAIISTDASVVADSSCGTSPGERYQSSDSTTLYAASWQRTLLDSASGVWRIHRDTTIGAVSYEGIVGADGNLTIDGSAELRGLVIARGRVAIRGGARVTGGVVSQGSGVELSASQIRFSPCQIGRVLRRALGPRRVRGRAWAELF